MPRYYVQTDRPGGGYIPEHTTHIGASRERAEVVYNDTPDGVPIFSIRSLHEFDLSTGEDVVLNQRTIYKRAAGAITFTPAAQRMLRRWAMTGNKVALYLSASNGTVNDKLDFVSIVEGEFEFLPEGRTPEMLEEYESRTGNRTYTPFGPSNRQRGKPAKVARKMIEANSLALLSDDDFEAFATLVKSDTKRANQIDIVSGQDIAYYYHHDQYAGGGSTLQTSCMRYGKCQTWLDMYTDNPDNISMAVMLNEEGLLIGRALLWTLDDGRKFLDRVYGTGVVERQFRAWGRAQGYLNKVYNGAGRHMEIEQEDTNINYDMTMFVTLADKDHRRWPYMDTFCWIDEDSGRLTNNHTRKHTHTMTSTEGHRSESGYGYIWPEEDGGPSPGAVPCYDCRTASPDALATGETRNGRFYCRPCFNSNFPSCARCAASCNRYDMYTTTEGVLCRRCYTNRYFECCACGRSYTLSSSHYTREDGRHACNACADRGSYYCSRCNQYDRTLRNFDVLSNCCIPCRDAALADGMTLEELRGENDVEEEYEDTYDEDDDDEPDNGVEW